MAFGGARDVGRVGEDAVGDALARGRVRENSRVERIRAAGGIGIPSDGNIRDSRHERDLT